jgi:hypothetical protein
MATTVLLLAALLTVSVFAVDDKATLYPEGTIDKQALERILPDKPPYSPYADLNFPARPLFGDTHVHTSNSLDAGAAGHARRSSMPWNAARPIPPLARA